MSMKRMDAILFDLDNTLYPPERELFSLIDVRINRYMQEVAGIPAAAVDGLRRRYWAEYGVTLGGLIRHHGVDPEDYVEYVHDVDVERRLTPDAGLRIALQALPRGVKHAAGKGAPKLHHFCIYVDSNDVIDEIYPVLKRRKIPIVSGPETLVVAGNRSISFLDPDGNRVEIACNRNKFKFDHRKG